nr:hypothetical protein [Skermanella stibiiresistens]
MCSLRQERRLLVSYFSTNHSPGPPSFNPELSTIKWIGPPVAWGCAGAFRLWASRLRVEKFDINRLRPSSRGIEPISPSVWRGAERNPARNIRPVVVARSE